MPTAPARPPSPGPRRRAVVVAAPALAGGIALAATACDASGGSSSSGAAGASASASTGTDTGASSAPPSPDEQLLAGVVRALAHQVASLEATGRAQRDLRRLTTPLVRTHRAHLALLAPDGAPRSASRRPQRFARAGAVVASEKVLARRLEAACLRAASGELARVLASASAGTEQALAVLPAAGSA